MVWFYAIYSGIRKCNKASKRWRLLHILCTLFIFHHCIDDVWRLYQILYHQIDGIKNLYQQVGPFPSWFVGTTCLAKTFVGTVLLWKCYNLAGVNKKASTSLPWIVPAGILNIGQTMLLTTTIESPLTNGKLILYFVTSIIFVGLPFYGILKFYEGKESTNIFSNQQVELTT